MKKSPFLVLLICSLIPMARQGFGQKNLIDAGWHHLRNTGEREWTEFPRTAQRHRLSVSFPASKNASPQTVSFRQYDVKLTWKVILNGHFLGRLVADEKDLISYLPVEPGLLKEDNTLEVFCDEAQADDIMLGNITLHQTDLDSILAEARIVVEIFDEETQEYLPARITIVNDMGTLQSVSADTTGHVAVRPGHVYTASGKIHMGLPAGTYILYAARGFEYSVDSIRIDIKSGETADQKFLLKREVSTVGWASSDTHIHTFTWSRHGDASAAERAITIAGEGVELAVMTDHNLHVDLKPFVIEKQVVRFFTPVTGNEVTTPVGHFNLFPLSVAEPVINHNTSSWTTLAERIKSSDEKIAIILNHARDIHRDFRPFDPSRHLASAGMPLDDRDFFPNAMEVINSGSQQTDQFQLMRDWFGMLNHGNVITPVGSSDSHDVSRFIVGQARTYIRSRDEDPANIDVQEAVSNFVDGSVLVSFGLLAEIEINESYGPGELVPGSDEAKVSVKVSGPSWTKADKVSLYANGKKIREAQITNGAAGGIKWSGEWNLTVPPHDIFLVAVAEGPGLPLPFWPIAKPYQPASPEWHPRVFSLTGAVWIDGDRNRERSSARHYAETLYRQAGNDMHALIQSLASFDEAVSVQAAALLHLKGKNLRGAEITKALRKASPETRSAFQTVINELPEK